MQTGERSLLRGFFFGSYGLSLSISIGVGCLGAIIVWTLQPRIGSNLALAFYLACATLPAFAVQQIQNGISRSYDWFALATVPQFVIRQVVLIGFLGVFYASGVMIDAAFAMVASSVAMWSIVLGVAAVINRRLSSSIDDGARSYDLPAWFSTSLPMFAVESVFLMLSNVDVF